MIDDVKKEVTFCIPNGLVSEVKKLKGHVTVKYKENTVTQQQQQHQSTSDNGASTSPLPSPTTPVTPTPTTTTTQSVTLGHSLKKSTNNLASSSSSLTVPASSSSSSSSTTSTTTSAGSEKALILEIRCRDFNLLRICLPSNQKGNEAHATMLRYAFPESTTTLFAKAFAPYISEMSANGWQTYDPVEDYERQGLLAPGSNWRLTKINAKYDICDTYPASLLVPSTLSDYMLQRSASFRCKSRFPACTWRHPYTHASLSRSGQPIGQGKSRCEEDESLLQAIRKSTPVDQVHAQGLPQPLFIYDLRAKSSIGSLHSNFSEDHINYPHCYVEYAGLPNINELRECSTKLFKAIRNWDEKKSWDEIDSSGWLAQVGKLLLASKRVLQILHSEGLSVLIHCTEGWDRTPQLMSLVQLLADPYYRTIKGFVQLICKEWLSFGHKFMTRSGTMSGSALKQTSPVFLQFIDCVWQLTRQFPTSFEFTAQVLTTIIHHIHSNLFGTFLFDSDKERSNNKVQNDSVSLWYLLIAMTKERAFINPLYSQSSAIVDDPELSSGPFVVRKDYDKANILVPNLQNLQLWADFYLKWRYPVKPSRKTMTLVDRALAVHGFNGDLVYIQKKKKERHARKSQRRSNIDHLRARKSSKTKESIANYFTSDGTPDADQQQQMDQQHNGKKNYDIPKLLIEKIDKSAYDGSMDSPAECEELRTSTTTTTTTTTATSNNNRRNGTAYITSPVLSPTDLISPSSNEDVSEDSVLSPVANNAPASTNLNQSIASQEKELAKQQRRKEKKERREKKRAERRRKKQEKKDMEEKKTPDISVVLHGATKTISLRSPKSRISIFSASSTPMSPTTSSPSIGEVNHHQESPNMNGGGGLNSSTNGNTTNSSQSAFARIFKTITIRHKA
ncbi:hypothetical protein SAMD00019534_103330 [Acytostelium subglobosum LB1]|uniref:hypothetical protein n=1 Tax=Acytostelium subglobosum LB1 TaxID=1410327 RepID=UPI0006447C3F|nr:hypothetical protein SAMD00019534_103330 [Acytostelium subglobosum LB1]GAM27158.1 hypothetical protein SAMD00019534_103330 [Acytostelium subglobosum LB1]|eukprot:XP_012750038.1 hypothetical protein SAMD00019534_103330 [Acytostelium subglobosum LB1]